ncbi:hypothetical protein HOY80DRAFT_1052508 [Tuber brumale]|nr:hypothetical protein HOY80DRAFT_1052508 [Tuber brumale]
MDSVKLQANEGSNNTKLAEVITAIGDKSYEDLEPFTVAILDGVRTLDLPIMLGMKIRSWWLRDDDSYYGIQKAASDISDINFLCMKMKQADRVVDDLVAGTLDLFLSVGGDKFQIPWDEDTEDQRELYELMIAPPSDEEEDELLDV